MRGWRPALRLAWRDAWQHRARSVLVLVMIALPVLAVTAAAVVQASADVDGVDRIERTMGASQARIESVGGRVFQAPDPMQGWGGGSGRPPGADDLEALVGDRDALSIAESHGELTRGDREIEVFATEVDLRDPLAAGLFELRTGDLPGRPGEVVVNEAFAERGVAIGDTLVHLGQEVAVVGVGRHATWRGTPTLTGMPGTFGPDFPGNSRAPDLLVGGDAVDWDDVQALNAQGVLVHSRAVLLDPPPVRERAEEMGVDTGYADYVAIVALVIAMALLEVVLLAGPAFAVGARRQARSLALLAASGGTPRQARRVVLASGVVLGAVAVVVGAALGILLGLALLPLVQRLSTEWFGTPEVNWVAVAIVAVFGLLSAFLAAVVPAWLASRQDVVAVLAGRRGDPPPSARTPILGLVLLGAGVALSVVGVQGGEFAIAIGAVVAVFGMILVVPLVVSVVARLAGRLPLVMRYAARDAARHRTRTVPAVAAVAATVAGVVALGIATSSDEAENRETYQPTLAMGAATIGVAATWGPNAAEPELPPVDAWERIEEAVSARLPDVTREVIEGQLSELEGGGSVTFEPLDGGGEPMYLDWLGGAPSNATTVVSDGAVPGIFAVSDAERTEMAAALRAGRAVVFANDADDIGEAEFSVRQLVWGPDGRRPERTRHTWPALLVDAPPRLPVQLILPSALAEETGVPVRTIGYHFPDPDLSTEVEQDLDEVVGGISEGAMLYVERGYQAPEEAMILILVLFALGGVLMLGGTLTATFLALSDARPDLATLAAVGAAPRSRRGVAASYALVVGFVGAVLGAIVGFIPGVAITYPLTTGMAGVCVGTEGGAMRCDNPGPFLDVPWLMIAGLVLVLPLLTALVVGLTARSRLPLVSRLT